MVRSVPVLIMVCVLAAPSHASAACRVFGTQLECDLGANRVVIGTQAGDEPTHGKSSPPQAFGSDRSQDDGARPALPFELELQDVDPHPSLGADLSVCRDTEDEIYCE